MSRTDANTAPKRLLVINPNTNPKVTKLMRGVVVRLALPGIAIDVVNPLEGPVSIESVADRAQAEPNVIEIVRAAHRSGTQAFALACFDDIGVSAARDIASGPVLDACEAGVIAARSFVDRFAVVTTVASAVDRIERLVASYGAASICSVRAARIGVADAAVGDGGQRLHETIVKALESDGAKAIILGSGGLAGRADALSRQYNVPVIDGVAAAISICGGILAMQNEQVTTKTAQ